LLQSEKHKTDEINTSDDRKKLQENQKKEKWLNIAAHMNMQQRNRHWAMLRTCAVPKQSKPSM
jgi:hypothetical protein